MIWKSPFNRVVRSHEAGIIGFLTGIVVGILLLVFIPIPVDNANFNSPVKLCGSLANVKEVHYTYIGTVNRVECNDKRIFANF